MPWIIERDLTAVKGSPKGTTENAVGVTSANWVLQRDLTRAIYQFRLKDDDGNVYYYGLSTVAGSFAPLDDFGAPNAGCTSIEYFTKGEWQEL